jgi:hypothetical protein
LAIAPDLVIIGTREFMICYDGSFMPMAGFGIGISFGYRYSPTHIATFSDPTTITHHIIARLTHQFQNRARW